MSAQAPTDRQQRMAAWQAAMQFCPFCSGLGTQDNGDPCPNCLEVPGDMFSTLLVEANARGRREMAEAIERSIKSVDEHEPTPKELRGAA